MITGLPDEVTVAPPSKKEETNEPSQLYIIIGASVLAGAVLVAGIIAVILCKKKKNKEANGSQGDGDHNDKAGAPTEDRRHHIQVDANGYIAKAIPRGLSNGCGPIPNRITITANPLADADDNQVRYIYFLSCYYCLH